MNVHVEQQGLPRMARLRELIEADVEDLVHRLDALGDVQSSRASAMLRVILDLIALFFDLGDRQESGGAQRFKRRRLFLTGALEQLYDFQLVLSSLRGVLHQVSDIFFIIR